MLFLAFPHVTQTSMEAQLAELVGNLETENQCNTIPPSRQEYSPPSLAGRGIRDSVPLDYSYNGQSNLFN